MNLFNWCKTVLVIVPLALCACHKSEYPTKFISTDPLEFQAYQEKCSSRPSPPARFSVALGDANIFITYSQPAVKGRIIWGELVKYDEIWRTGANEATVLSSMADIMIDGDTLKKGHYALYTIPSKDKWTVILNTKYDVWGAYDYDESLDVLRFEVEPTVNNEFKERLSFNIDESGLVNFSWEKLTFNFLLSPI